jgi:hypothetical protein
VTFVKLGLPIDLQWFGKALLDEEKAANREGKPSPCFAKLNRTSRSARWPFFASLQLRRGNYFTSSWQPVVADIYQAINSEPLRSAVAGEYLTQWAENRKAELRNNSPLCP